MSTVPWYQGVPGCLLLVPGSYDANIMIPLPVPGTMYQVFRVRYIPLVKEPASSLRTSNRKSMYQIPDIGTTTKEAVEA